MRTLMARGRTKSARLILGAVVITSGLATVGAPPAIAATGGRLNFDAQLAYDSRGAAPVPAGTSITLSGFGQVAAIGRGVDGSFQVTTCNDGVVRSQHALAGTATEIVTYVADQPLCYRADVETDLIVTRTGTITATPSASRSQFVSVGVLDVGLTPGASADTFALSLPVVAPADATGAVFGVDVSPISSTGWESGTVLFSRCSAGTTVGGAVMVDDTQRTAMIIIDGSANFCARTIAGTASFRVTLLGWLTTDGPNVTALPPSIRSTVTSAPQPGLRAIVPTRVLDSRSGLGAPLGLVQPPGITLQNLPLTPASTAVVLNMTVTEPSNAGFVTVWPCDVNRPTVSNLNFVAGETVANQVTVALGDSRTICAFSNVATHLVADVTAVYEAVGGTGLLALTPARILDTRDGFGAKPEPVAGGGFIALQVTGRGGVPAVGAVAVAINVTATEGDLPGFLTVWPCDQPRPTASSLNYLAHQSIPNLVTAKLAADGTVCIFASSSVHVIADVATAYVVGAVAGFADVVPERILDTRIPIDVSAGQKVQAGLALTLRVVGRAGVPPTGVQAITVNITATEPDTAGFVTAWPCDRPRPTASNLNLVAGITRPNLATVQVSSAGTICLFSTARTHLIADVAGYATPDPALTIVTTIS